MNVNNYGQMTWQAIIQPERITVKVYAMKSLRNCLPLLECIPFIVEVFLLVLQCISLFFII